MKTVVRIRFARQIPHRFQTVDAIASVRGDIEIARA
jgi:hypothetical protein